MKVEVNNTSQIFSVTTPHDILTSDTSVNIEIPLVSLAVHSTLTFPLIAKWSVLRYSSNFRVFLLSLKDLKGKKKVTREVKMSKKVNRQFVYFLCIAPAMCFKSHNGCWNTCTPCCFSIKMQHWRLLSFSMCYWQMAMSEPSLNRESTNSLI